MKKQMKKLTALLVVMVAAVTFTLCVSAAPASAANNGQAYSSSAAASSDKNTQKAKQILEKANAKIYALIDNAQDKYSKLVAKGVSDSDPRVLHIVSELKTKTDEIVAKTSEKLKKLGFEFVCTYETIQFGSIEVVIDPFIAIG